MGLGLPYERLLNLGFRALRAGREPTEQTAVSATYVTAGYFETLGVPLLRGRALEGSDGPEAPPVAVVNRAFVDRFLAQADPLASAGGDRRGRAPGRGGWSATCSRARPAWGVAIPSPASGRLPPPGPGRERHVRAGPHLVPAELDRALGAAPEATAAAVRGAMAEVDPRLPFAELRPIGQVEGRALAEQRFLMSLIAALACIAALLAALGIQGLVANSVVERTREMGIRLALGSTLGQAIRAVALPGVGGPGRSGRGPPSRSVRRGWSITSFGASARSTRGPTLGGAGAPAGGGGGDAPAQPAGARSRPGPDAPGGVGAAAGGGASAADGPFCPRLEPGEGATRRIGHHGARQEPSASAGRRYSSSLHLRGGKP